MSVPTFFLPAVKNNVTTAQLVGAIGAGDTAIALKTGHGAQFGTILRGDCSSTGSSTLLNDTGALGSVAVGDFIYNLTDGSFAVVTSIASAPNSIATTPLEGGSDNTWQSGDVWVIGMFIATIVNYDTDGLTVLKRERVRVTNLSTDTLTVERGYDGDSAQTFSANDYVQVLIEKTAIENLQKAVRNLLQKDNDQSTLITNLQNDAPMWLGTITGTDTLTGTASPAKTAYAAGQRFMFLVANQNTGSVTLNVNSLGAKTIKKTDGATNLAAGDLKVGQLVMVMYDGTNFQMITGSGTVASSPTRAMLYKSTGDSNNINSGTGDTEFNTKVQIDANTSVAGDVLTFEAWGLMDGGVNNRQLRLKLWWGATQLIAFDALQPTSAGTKRAFYVYCQVTIRTIGATGTAQASGEVHVNHASTTAELFSRQVSDSTVTIDTTANKDFRLTQSWNVDDGTKHCYTKQTMIYRDRL